MCKNNKNKKDTTWRVHVLWSHISALLGVDRLNSGDLGCDKHPVFVPILCGIWGFIFQTVQICITTQGKHSSRDDWDLNWKRKVPELFSNCCFGSEPPAGASRAGQQSHSFWLLLTVISHIISWLPWPAHQQGQHHLQLLPSTSQALPPPLAVDCSFAYCLICALTFFLHWEAGSCALYK